MSSITPFGPNTFVGPRGNKTTVSGAAGTNGGVATGTQELANGGTRQFNVGAAGASGIGLALGGNVTTHNPDGSSTKKIGGVALTPVGIGGGGATKTTQSDGSWTAKGAGGIGVVVDGVGAGATAKGSASYDASTGETHASWSGRAGILAPADGAIGVKTSGSAVKYADGSSESKTTTQIGAVIGADTGAATIDTARTKDAAGNKKKEVSVSGFGGSGSASKEVSNTGLVTRSVTNASGQTKSVQHQRRLGQD